ncbi:MAG: aminoacyl-tRNA hydrolase [Pseudomonadaceae bacterium]|nr:aminoacyl-tRNA hydrolase [Pseudomonadaceae bacterium]
MHLLVGLGNPGKEYQNTRHNIGWMVLDAIHDAHGFPPWQAKFKGQYSKHTVEGHGVVLLKPHTYMNLSGQSVQPAATFFKIAPDHITAIHDELDLPFLALRHKTGGGDAGHNGLKSITAALGPNYHRLRIGIGRPVHKSDVSNYVLHPFTAAEALEVSQATTRIAEHLPLLLDDPKALLDKLAANQ